MGEGLRTVLIFAHECAPYHRAESTVGAQRPAQFAKHLPEYGWRAVVLCCDARERGRAAPAEIPAIAERVRERLRATPADASVVIPTPSLAWDGALDRCWRSVQPNGRSGAARAFARKMLTAAKLFTGDYSQSWQPCARAAAEAVAAAVRIDACIGEHSPDAGLFLARWFSKRYGAPWVADFRDPILQPFEPVARRLYEPIARRLLASASCTVNVNEVWCRYDRELFALPSHVIPNGFDLAEFASSAKTEWKPKFTITYSGNINPSQRLEIFIEGLALLKLKDTASASALRFVYRGGACERVARLAADASVSDLVDAAGYVERGEALALLGRSDALLLLSIARPEREDRYFAQGFYPAKTFEYFGARRPILCVPGDRGLLDELIGRTRTGVVLRTSEQIAAHLSRAVDEWRRGGSTRYEPDEGEVARYTRCNLAGALAEVLNGLGTPAASGRTGAR